MLKSIFYIFFIPTISIYGQEVLFNDFKYDMPIHDAKVILKNKPDWFKNLSLGKGTSYSLTKRSLVERDGKLVSINIWSKKHLDIKQAESYLKKSRTYLEAIGYNVVYAQENWSNPKLLKKNLPCIRFVDSEKQNLIEVYPRGHGSIYNVFATFYNYKKKKKKARGLE